MQILEETWAEGIHPVEKPFKHGAEYTRLLRKLSKSEAELTDKLSSEQFEMFDNYMSDYNRFRAISECESFIIGFQTGAKIMPDVFIDGEIKKV